MRAVQLIPRFVESIPEQVDAGVLYVSMTFATAIHLCACGCGREVVTPMAPTDWKLCFDGETVTLDPSIGNWGFPCHSHYWVRKNQIRWARSMSDKEIQNGRAYDRASKASYFDGPVVVAESSVEPGPQPDSHKDGPASSRLEAIWNWMLRRRN
jgi:hypothetical protein